MVYSTGVSVQKIPTPGLRSGAASFLILFFLLLSFSACSKAGEPDNTSNSWKGKEVWDNMWETSPLPANGLYPRNNIYRQIQTEADNCSDMVFKKYTSADSNLGNSLQLTYPILGGYDYAFTKVLNGVKNINPAKGEVYIWHLYNMGYVIKSCLGTFAIDIYHRRAEELAPYLDFYAITHKHTDHKWIPLAEKLGKSGVPVLANFDIAGCNGAYITDKTRDYVIKGHKIHTFITNHNNSSTNVDITVFKIDFGPECGDFVLVHSGDSNFRPEQFESVRGDKVDLYIPRYAQDPQAENNIIGKIFSPQYVMLSHILELGHADVGSSRWPIEYGQKRAATLDCSNTLLPLWGDLFSWKDGTLRYIKP